MGATDLFGSDAGWVGFCGLSCVAVDCTPPPSTRGTADSSKLTPNPNGLHYGLLDRLSLNVPGFNVQLGMAAVHHPVGDSR